MNSCQSCRRQKSPLNSKTHSIRSLDLSRSVIYHGIYPLGGVMTRTAKLFRNGRSQAVRLPSDYRFEGSEVFVRRDPATGDVILSRRPESWEDFFELMRGIDVPSD